MPFKVVYRDWNYENRLFRCFLVPGSVQPVNGIAAFRKVGGLYPSDMTDVNSVSAGRGRQSRHAAYRVGSIDIPVRAALRRQECLRYRQISATRNRYG